jgi:hypothetical protein
MISALMTLIIILGILLLFAIVLKLIRIGIILAVIVGIVALVRHMAKKKS